MSEFFTYETLIALMPILRLAFASAEGVGVVAIVDYLKGLFFRIFGRKLPGEFSLLATFGVSFLLAALALFIEGLITPADLAGTDIVATFVTVFMVAKVRYDMVRKNQKRKAAKELSKTLIQVANKPRPKPTYPAPGYDPEFSRRLEEAMGIDQGD